MADPVVEQIKQRVDIIELLSEYLKLQKSGSNWRALCPFHHENSPSFMVSQEKQIWHCFGCAKGGDVFSFIQEIEGIDFPEALKLLAQRANVTLTQYHPEQQDKKQRLLQVVALAQQFYQQALRESQEAEAARQYLTQRGLTDESIQSFGLGYSYQDWSRLKDFLQQQKVTETELTEAGLVINHHDRFRGRLMIPLQDAHGATVGFTARILQAQQEGGKYVNSPQSDIYDKSNLVFGLARAKTAIKKLNATLVVEGNLDVVTAQQHGFPNTVATSGTAFTEQQLLQLKRYSHNILLAFDLDAAGEQAANRGIDLALKHSMNIKVVRWPEQYKDPDECIRADAAAFKTAIREAIGIVDYWFLSASKDLQLTRVEHKKLLVQRLLPKLAKLSDTVEISHYVQQLADLVRVNAQLLQEQLKRLQTGKVGGRSNAERVTGNTNSTVQVKPQQRDRATILVEYIIGLLLVMPEQFSYANDYMDLVYITDPTLHDLYNRMQDQYNKAGQFTESDYLSANPEDGNLLGRLRLQIDRDFPVQSPTEYQSALIRTMRELRKQYIERRLRDIEVLLKQTELQSASQLEQQTQDQTGDALTAEAQLLTQQLTELSL